MNPDFTFVRYPGMDKTLLYALVCVLKFNVFSNEGNVDRAFRVLKLCEKIFQRRKVWSGKIRDPKFVDDHLVQPFLLHVERDLIDAPGVNGLYDMAGLDVAEEGNLVPEFRGEFLFRPADDDIRVDTQGLEFLDGMLGWLGFQFLCRFEIRD